MNQITTDSDIMYYVYVDNYKSTGQEVETKYI